jgi:hypothetical protein
MGITIEDAASGTRVLEAYFTLEGFMSALTASYGVSGDAVLYNGPVGFKSETKTEVIPRPKDYKRNDKEIAKLLAPFEIDGWRLQSSSLDGKRRGKCDFPSLRQ